MTATTQVAELKKKHELLSKEVRALHKKPRACTFALKNLKKEKLRLKDQMTKLIQST